MYSLIFYVPLSHLEEVKNALFAKGAGTYDKYDCCAWQVKGEGQYRPLPESNPFKGSLGKVEKTEEFKVEMIVRDEIIRDVLEELIKIHPYEEVAYHVVAIETLDTIG